MESTTHLGRLTGAFRARQRGRVHGLRSGRSDHGRRSSTSVVEPASTRRTAQLMTSAQRQQHWESIYKTRSEQQVSCLEDLSGRFPSHDGMVGIDDGDVRHRCRRGRFAAQWTGLVTADSIASRSWTCLPLAGERARSRLGGAASVPMWLEAESRRLVPEADGHLAQSRMFHFLTSGRRWIRDIDCGCWKH